MDADKRGSVPESVLISVIRVYPRRALVVLPLLLPSYSSIQLAETVVRGAICDSLSLATVVLLNDLGASALESQIASLTPVLVNALDTRPSRLLTLDLSSVATILA